MENRTDINIMDFSSIFQSLASSQRTGILKVDNYDENKKYFYFHNGVVQLMDLPGKRDIGAMAFLKSGLLSEDEIQELIQMKNKSHDSIAHLALKSGMLQENDILEALGFWIQEQVCDVFLWEDVHCEFYDKEKPTNYEDFEFLSHHPRLHPNSLLMEAARRNDEWSLIKEFIPSFKNVYRVNPDSFHFFDESDPNTQYIREILSLVDGHKDVEEITSMAKMSKFDALCILKDLVESGEVSPLSSDEILKLGFQAQKKGNIKKALRLYERAEELGVNQYDLPDRIGKAYEALGRTRKAIEKYLDFAAKCCAQNKLDDAILTYHKIIRLDSNDIATHEKLISLLLEQGRKEEAVREYKILIQKYKKFDENDKLLDAWKAVCRYSPGVNEEAYEELATLYREIGDTVQAIIDFDELATSFMVEERFEEAAAIFRKILTIDEECIDARLQLASTLSRIGKTDEAVQEYKKMAEMLSMAGVIKNSANWEFLITTYEKIVDLEPDNYLARKWLAEAYQEKGEKDKSVAHLKDIIGIFQRRDATENLIEPLELLLSICPDEVRHYEDLAHAYLKTEQREEAIRVYHQAAQLSLNQKQLPQARSYFLEVLDVDPFDLEAHNEIAQILKKQNMVEEAVEKYKDIARLCEGAKMYLEALSACEEIFRIVVDETNALKMIARLYEKCEGRQGALEHYLKYAQKSLRENNLGETKMALNKVRALDPTNPEIEKIEYDLQNRESMMAGGAPIAPLSSVDQEGDESTILFSNPPTTKDKSQEKTKVRKKDGSKIIRPTITVKKKGTSSRNRRPKKTSEPEPSSQSISNHLQKLKAMKKGMDSSSSGSGGGDQNEQRVSSASMKNFADKLKSLKLGGGSSGGGKSSSEEGDDSDQKSSEGTVVEKKNMLSAADKLRGLKKKD